MTVPTDYGNLWVYLRGDSGFTDLSGNGRTITIPDGGDRPTLEPATDTEHAAFGFVAGLQQNFRLPNMTALTEGEVFVVFRVNADPAVDNASSGFWQLGSSTADAAFPNTAGAIGDTFGSTTSKNVGDVGPHLTDVTLYNARSSTGLWEAEVNGSNVFTTATNVVGFPANPRIGNSVSQRYLDGKIYELAIYSTRLSSGDRAALSASLIAKYAAAPPVADHTRATRVLGLSISEQDPSTRATRVQGLVISPMQHGGPPGGRFWVYS